MKIKVAAQDKIWGWINNALAKFFSQSFLLNTLKPYTLENKIEQNIDLILNKLELDIEKNTNLTFNITQENSFYKVSSSQYIQKLYKVAIAK